MKKILIIFFSFIMLAILILSIYFLFIKKYSDEVWLLKIKDNVFYVADKGYDGDAKDDFEIRQLKVNHKTKYYTEHMDKIIYRDNTSKTTVDRHKISVTSFMKQFNEQQSLYLKIEKSFNNTCYKVTIYSGLTIWK